jgi:hypothetical protein
MTWNPMARLNEESKQAARLICVSRDDHQPPAALNNLPLINAKE